jgi:tetratricopeptide (TPR) repeat protein
LYFLGRAYLDTGSVDTAITTLESAVSAGSLDPDLFRSIARAYYEKDDFDTAIEYYDRAVAYAGENIEESLLSEYMDFLIEENYLTQAQDLLDIAQKYFEETWVDIYAVEVNYLLKDNEKVDYYIEQGLEREDITTEEKKTILYWQARIAVEDGDLESAEDILADLKQLDRFNPFYYLLMGDVLYEKADFENAKTNYESAIEYDLGEGVSSEAEKALARLD